MRRGHHLTRQTLTSLDHEQSEKCHLVPDRKFGTFTPPVD